jgi:ATP-dependent DNA helicase RecG
MENPDIEILSGGEPDFLHTLGLVPVYPLTEGLGQKQLRRLMRAVVEDFVGRVPENLPMRLMEDEKLVSRREALRSIHFPDTTGELEAARKRIAFEEFLALQVCVQSTTSVESGGGIAHDSAPTLTSLLDERIGFHPTRAQRRAIAEVFRRMESPHQMNVLLQGDVGAGKTLVGAYSMLKAVENGRQAVLMAPTEILAEQHCSLLRELLHGTEVRIALLSGSRSAADRKDALELLASGTPSLVVGTHALIGKGVDISNAGLIIIDEQHRFGVNQRAALREKDINPDLIVMTATPIPRTLALALYGNFETVIIDECPPGRHPVETRHVQGSDREWMRRLVREQIESGRQAFVICPEIGPRSGPADRTMASATRTHREISRMFADFSVGLLHGRIPSAEREKAILRFRSGDIQILVATTMVEVGVDVPNATIMIIENADRFGLAQLHQLRGRVGRGHHKSYCLLAAEPSTEEAARRMDIMISTNDGFRIAEQDMLLRGPGEFLGAAQSGLPRLRIGHLVKDSALLERARRAARTVLGADPRLEAPENAPLRHLPGVRRLGTVHL